MFEVDLGSWRRDEGKGVEFRIPYDTISRPGAVSSAVHPGCHTVKRQEMHT